MFGSKSSMINFVPFISIIIVSIALVNGDGTRCFFNEKCMCKEKGGRNVFSLVECNGVKEFPEFKIPQGMYAVETLVISGVIKEMPQKGLDMFKYVKYANINRTNYDEAFSIQGGGKYILTNCTMQSLSIKGFPDAVPLGSGSGYGLGIHPKTLAGLIDVIIEKSTVRFTEDAFHGANSLTRLSMSDDHIADGAFRSSSALDPLNQTLTLLDLSNNKLESYQPVFQVLHKLESLRLDGNQIGDLSAANFSQMTDLKNLSLHQNRLIKFDGPKLFPAGTHSLELLDLGDNRLSTVPLDALTSLPRLKSLSLSLNNITNLTSPFPNVQLEQLILDHNPIQEFPLNVLGRLGKLQNFSVTGWNVDQLDLSSFNGTGLNSLLVHNNSRLSKVGFSNLTTVPVTLTKIDISNNNLTILDESLAQLFKNNTKMMITISNESNFDCGQVDQSSNLTTAHPSSSLVWLANLAACEVGNRIQIDETTVFCSWNGGQNSSEPVKFIDYLRNLDHNCPVTPSTTRSPTTVPGHAIRTSSHLLDSVMVIAAGLILCMRI